MSGIHAHNETTLTAAQPYRAHENGASHPPSQTEEEAVRRLFHSLMESWGGDAAAYAAHFTEDADYIAFDGSLQKGREEIRSAHQPLFERWLKGSRLEGTIIGLRFLAPTVALLHATGGIVLKGRKTFSRSRLSIQTFVAVREGDEWRFAAFHNNRIQRQSLLRTIFMAISTVVFRQ